MTGPSTTLTARGVENLGRTRVVRSVAELRATLEPSRREDLAIGLVATMGALHVGHLSLIERARQACDVVVVSLFVNPSQFDEHADLERYPRDEQRDLELAEAAGADLLFAPGVQDVYPEGFATAVEVFGLTDRLEGKVRGAAHFRGVATVVTKLLNMVSPDVAYFGQKDAQQAIVIRRLVRDLNLPVAIETCPTVREPDGLAMSSRNARLEPRERERAVALHAGLQAARMAAADGERSAAELASRARAVMNGYEIEPEYLELVDPTTLEPVAELTRPALLAVAARIGETRLIDNFILQPPQSQNKESR
ncbi:MAG TPA: pantoate--beta-alanine ligase [Solirubrobacteraceae bacterium]|nr:pantoate--beta-alanine ligase [Solirubrobacteraceae bacterium]